jgi:cytochrome c peroxidase
MTRGGWVGVVGLALAGVAFAAQPPVLPRDTLPANLSLNAVPRVLKDKLSIPRDNPLTEAKVQLGRRLFFDPILSENGTVACASCHQPEHGFAFPARYAPGIGGKLGSRNVPTLLNRALGSVFFWDGRVASLEEQALHPIASATEMGSTVEQALSRLRAHREYPRAFTAAFGEGVTAENLARALASFERTLVVGESRVDHFRAGVINSLTAPEKHGLWLYESRGRCWRCHPGPTYSDETFHNTGVSWGKPPLDLGRYAQTKKDADRGKFKTPTLRGLTRTAPYMHDGSLATLEEVVAFYNKGGQPNAALDPLIGPLGLSAADERDLVAFLKALSDPLEIGNTNPR